jgi:predicted nucleotidyltransferase
VHAATSISLLLDRLRGELSACPEVLEAYLFGSVARQEAQPHSDVDVAVFVAPSALDRAGFGYDAELGAKLQQALARSDVDIVVLNHAGPVLYHRVLRDGMRIFSRDLAATTTREGNALSRYCDYLPTLRKIETLHRERISSGAFGSWRAK